MKTRTIMLAGAAAAVSFLLAGCCSYVYDSKFDVGKPNLTIDISKAKGKVTLDGVINEKEWAGATIHYIQEAYPYTNKKLTPAKVYANVNKKGNRVDPYEGGTVRLMYDDKYLYIGAVLTDSDIMQYGKVNQSHFYLTGDLLEMFLKPKNAPSYWECYGTPNAKKTSLFFENRRFPFNPKKNILMDGMIVATKINGTFNNYKDKDTSWSIEVAFPLEQLKKTGRPFKPGEPWTVLIARYNYNYGSKQSNPHYSTYPELPVVNYHHLEYYADVNWK